MKLFDFTADKNKLSSKITESKTVVQEESINESLQALAKHVKEGSSLCASPFRHGSKAYLETFQLAKKLREAGSLPELDWESEEMLATDVGESVKLKNGETVWLDIPYLNEDEDDKGYTFDTDGPDLVITSPEGKTKVLKDFTYFDEDPSQAELKSFFNRGKSLRDESIEEAEEGMIGEPDGFYDAEERKEAYNDLQDALQGNYMDDYIKDGDCPACGGSGYMDGEETFINDDGEEEESSECDGFGNYGCDEGEMTYGSDGPSWVEIIKHDESNAQRQKSKDEYPGDEEVTKQVAAYMKRMDDPRMAYQQMQADFPHMGRGQRSEILGKASKMAFGEGVMDMDWKSSRELDMSLPLIKSYNTPEENAVGKILGKALDKKDWEKYSPQELFSELESVNPALADDIAKIAKIVYKVKLEERAYKDVGVADVHTDARGKEFKFDKDSKKFKSMDGEEADPKTKVGKELMRKRRNAMKKSSPSYNKKGVMRGTKPMERPPAPKKGGFLSNLFNDAISEGEERSIIRDAVVQNLVDTFGEQPGLYADNKEDLEAKMYSDLEALHVEDVVDPRMEVGGQPIGDFASGRVLDVVSANEVIEDALQHINLNDMEDFDEGKSPFSPLQQAYDKVYQLTDKMGDEALEQMNRYAPKFSDALEKHDSIESIEQNDSTNVEYYIKELDDVLFQISEGKSPHKKGTKKYKKHMAAIHAGEGVQNEAEYNGKDVELNKPKRGGSKKYYVYVKNPKTDRVKKISFGDVTGLKTKANNKKRAKSFAARHNCEKKNDKMKAGYWACRLPRYGLVKGGKWW